MFYKAYVYTLNFPLMILTIIKHTFIINIVIYISDTLLDLFRDELYDIYRIN